MQYKINFVRISQRDYPAIAAYLNNTLHTEPRAARLFLLGSRSPRPGERCRYPAKTQTLSFTPHCNFVYHMPKKPSKIVFICESCGCSPRLSCRTLREGDCRKCDQCATWKVEAHYTEKNTNYGRTALGIFCLLVFGRGWLLDQSVHLSLIHI